VISDWEKNVETAEAIDDLVDLGILEEEGAKSYSMPKKVFEEIVMCGLATSDDDTPLQEALLRGCITAYLKRKGVAKEEEIYRATRVMMFFVKRWLEGLKNLAEGEEREGKEEGSK
jgi:hypothetical protein